MIQNFVPFKYFQQVFPALFKRTMESGKQIGCRKRKN